MDESVEEKKEQEIRIRVKNKKTEWDSRKAQNEKQEETNEKQEELRRKLKKPK